VCIRIERKRETFVVDIFDFRRGGIFDGGSGRGFFNGGRQWRRGFIIRGGEETESGER
jgi:hypothetical protein